MLTNNDLRHNQYDIETLERNIDNLNHKTLLITQKLTAEFCIKYLYVADIYSGDEDSYLFDITYILAYQPHITIEELYKQLHAQ